MKSLKIPLSDIIKNLKRISILAIVSVLFLTINSGRVFAQGFSVVDIPTAKSAALKYCLDSQFKYSGETQNDLILVLAESRSDYNNILYYVFNINENDGFIITSATYYAPPVLAYIPKGSYVTKAESRPPAFNDWLDACAARIGDLIKYKEENTEWQNMWNAFLSKGPLDSETLELKLTSKWDQGAYFNYYSPTPGSENGRSPTGCVATAMGQIMKYFRWPLTSEGDHSYTDPAQPNPLRPCDNRSEASRGVLSFSDHGLSRTYDYSLMDDIPTSINSEISKLLYHAGVSVNMDYAEDASWTNTFQVPGALSTYFRYNNSIQYVEKQNYSEEEWKLLLKEQIRMERPVEYRGSGSNSCGGHSWVCYGYKEMGGQTYFLFNWGWGGDSDGYFLIGGFLSFYYFNGAVINIFPTEQPDLIISSASVNEDPILIGVPFSFGFTIKNEGTRDAQNSVAACYLSNDQILDKYDIFIDTIRIKSLQINQTIIRTKSATIADATSGTYYLLVEADSEHDIHESDENHNNHGVPENLFPVEINVSGSTVYDYRTASSGSWTNASSWEYYYNDQWLPAITFPGSSSGNITIRNNHTITISVNLSIDELTIESGGQINISNGYTLTVLNGSDETDFNISGILVNSGAINPVGAISFNSGSIYQHAINGGVIPRATWNDESTCLITGITVSALSGFDQSFGNFTYNCTGQTNYVAINNNTTIKGDFTLLSTGSGRLVLTSSSTTKTLTILGNYTQSGGTFDFCIATSGNSSSLHVAGNFFHSSGAGTITVSGNAQNGLIVFNGTGQQSLSFVNPNGAIWVSYAITSGSTVTMGSNLTLSGNPSGGYYSDMTVNGTINTNSYIISGDTGSRFYLNSGATIITANTNSTGALTTSGTNGSIQVEGSRSYNTGANYTYNGTVQVTGNGLPTSAISGNVTIETGSVVTTTNPLIVNGILAVNGILVPGSSSQVISGSGNLTGSGTVKVNRTTSIPDFSSQYTISNKDLSNLTVEYALLAGGQVISPLSYYKLVLDNTSGSNTLGGNTTISGTLTTTAGGTLRVDNNYLLTAANVSNSGILTIAPNAQATLSTITNNGILNLNASEAGMASLITGSYGGSGISNLQMHLTGGGGDEAWKWHYISSPVQSTPITIFGSNTQDLARYDESLVVSAQNDGWIASDGYIYRNGSFGTGFSTMELGKGYAYYYPSDQNYTISGSINTDAVNIPLAYNTGGSGIENIIGFNLIGNPFTCSLDWDIIDDGLDDVNIMKAIYYTRDYSLFPTWNNGVGTDGGSQYIVPTQAIFVDARASGQTLTLPVSAKSHNFGTYYSSGRDRFKGANEEKIPLIRLLLEGKSNKRDAVIRFDEKAVLSFDSNFDSYSLGKELGPVSLWTKLAGTDYAINTIPYPEFSIEIPVAMHTSEAGTFSLGSGELSGLEFYTVILKDKVTNTAVDLKNGDKISFSTQEGVFENRFVLVITSMTTGTEETIIPGNKFKIYSTNRMVNIVPISEEWDGQKGLVKIIDLTGKTVSDYRNLEFNKNNIIQLPSPGLRGIYFIEIRSPFKQYFGSIIIK